jgi:cell division protein FtsB
VSQIQDENEQLSAEIQALRSDPTTIEKLAREELRLVKIGEVVSSLPENPPVGTLPLHENGPRRHVF